MSYAIHQIDRERLGQMADVLSESAGYRVDVSMELSYFVPQNSHGWAVASNLNNQHVGFIRDLAKGSDWSVVEFYVHKSVLGRCQLAQDLLVRFSKEAKFPAGHRLRIDVDQSDNDLNVVVQELGFSQKKQLFRYFEASNFEAGPGNELQQKRQSPDKNEIVQVLANLGPVSLAEVDQWLKNETIRAVFNHARLASVAQVEIGDDAVEIVRIATNAQNLRMGFAQKLIQEIKWEAFRKNKKVFLRVDDLREPAINLYKKLGFDELSHKNQIWHSRWC